MCSIGAVRMLTAKRTCAGQSCTRLRQLFLSSNRVVLVEPLLACQELHTLCLYKNSIINLGVTLRTLRGLPRVRPRVPAHHCRAPTSACS